MSALPHPARDLPQQCDALLEAGDLAGALAVARAILARHPDRPTAHLRVGTILLRQGDEAAAEAVFAHAAAAVRPHAPLLSQLGQIAARRGDYAAAAGYFRQAVALEPLNGPHHARLADSLARGGDLAGAIASQREAVRLAPHHPPLRAQLAAFEAQAQANAANSDAVKADEVRVDAAAAAAPRPAIAMPPAASAASCGEPAAPPGSQRTALAGADGFLFHEVDYAFQQICEGAGSDAEALRLLTFWQLRHAWCSARGIDFRVLIVPEKHAVYPDLLPPPWRLDENRMAARLMRMLDAPMAGAVIYPVAAMQAARARRQVCLRQDVHWTYFGAFQAYRELVASVPALAGEALREEDLLPRPRRSVGDIALWLDLRTREELEDLAPPPVERREVFSTKSFSTGQVDVFETDNPGGRRLVMFRTSNATALLPMLARHFTRIVAVATTAMLYDLVRSEQPHLVICELPERYLAMPAGNGRIRMPRDLDADAFAEITGCRLPLPGAVA